MKKYKVFTGLIVMLLIQFGALAQPPHEGKESHQERRKKIQAMKVEFITTKLAMTPAEAQKFWPVYNEFNEKLHQLEKERRKATHASRDIELSDKEMEALIQMNFDTDQKILDLKREYDLMFKKVLSIQKVGKLYMAEAEFKHELLRKMKRGGPPPH